MPRTRRDRLLEVLDGVETFGVSLLLLGLTWSEATKSLGLAIAVVGLLARLAVGGRVALAPKWTHLWLGFYFCVAGVSLALASGHLSGPKELLMLGMTIAAFPLVADLCGRSPSRRVLLAFVIIAGAGIGAVLGYFEHMAGPYNRLALPSIENAIPAGEYLAAVVAFAVGVLFAEIASTTVGPLLGFCAGACAIALLMTKSRGPFLGAAAGVLSAGAISLRRRWIVPAAALVLVAAVTLFWMLNPDSRIVREGVVHSRSAANRVRTWEMSLDRFAERPVVGHGVGSFPLLGIRVVDELGVEWEQNAHNVVLHSLVETGLAGTAALVCFLALGLRDVVRALRRRGWKHHRAITAGSLAGAVALLVSGVFSVSVDAEPGILLFALLALGASGDARPADPARVNDD
ncbi:MAG: O-antigen ligase family protein [Candidatus Eisenbacteria bacterium]|nr:O-antigen ligase family protein [Candidatus Eisenbacteria bacterium]